MTGEIITSSLPFDKQEIDGSVLTYSDYPDFIDYMADLYDSTPIPDYFAVGGTYNFEQPTLSSNGTVGGDSFACFASSSYDNSRYPAYRAFDGRIDNLTEADTYWCSSTGSNQYIGFYNPIALNVTSIRMYNQQKSSGDGVIAEGKVQGSNDNSTYTDLATFSGNTYGTTYIDIDLSSNTNAYKYYRILATSKTGNYATAGELVITATYTVTAEEIWQNAVDAYGVCNKYVYDGINKTLRLPKYGNSLYTSTNPVNAYYYLNI